MKKSTNVWISITVAGLLAAVFFLRGTPNEHPDSLATENPPPNESAIITHAIARLNTNQAGSVTVKPKYHGCLRGTFTVISNLPESLQSKLFSPGVSYSAQLRFSAHHGGRPDTAPNMQGMAIKLFGVPGQKIAKSASPDTHDFILGSYPILFSPDIQSYLDGLKALEAGKPRAYFYNPTNLQISGYKISRKMFAVQTDLTIMRWWSMVPYKFNEGQAVKYSARPCQIDREIQDKTVRNYGQGITENFLRERLAETASSGPLCFEFMVQIQSDSKTMPIEDPTVEWDDTLAPFQPIAVLTTPIQDMLTTEQQRTCNNLKFHPWQALPAHQPLGGINRARRVVYRKSKDLQ